MAMTAEAMRIRYADSSIATAPPARLLIMLYDRLVRDLVAAEVAIAAADMESAHNELVHAQAIVTELQCSLDVETWDGAPGLDQLYTFLHGELVAANAAKDVGRVTACRELVDPLREAWHQAALEAGR